MKSAAERQGKTRPTKSALENALQLKLAQVHGRPGLGIPETKTLFLVMEVNG